MGSSFLSRLESFTEPQLQLKENKTKMASQMLKAQGKVETVFVKALPEKDKYENTHRASIKLDNGEWYGMGSIKSDTLTVENDEGKWVPLGEGSEVILKYTKNGDYNNSKRSDMMILNLVTGEKRAYEKKPASSGGNSGSTGGGGVDWARKDAGAAASASIDKALAYIAMVGVDDINYSTVLGVARDMQKMVQQLAGEILTGGDAKVPAEKVPASNVTTSKPAASKPPRAARPPEETAEWVDDEEIPF